METGKISRRRQSFTMVANKAMRDKHLSLKAKGLYALMQSYLDMSSIGFVVYKSYLQNNTCADGKDSFNSAWKELEKAGYLLVEKTRTSKGTYAYEYTLLDEPINTDPHTAHPDAENPALDKPVMDVPKTVKPAMAESAMDKPTAEKPSLNKETLNQNLEKNTEHIYFSQITPEEFLIAKQNGTPLSSQDKTILRTLAKYGFSNEVQVALLDHVLSVSQNRLIKSFVEMVAGEWARDGVKTADDVKRETSKTLSNHKKTEVLPAYYYESQQEKDAEEKPVQSREEMMAWFEKMRQQG